MLPLIFLYRYLLIILFFFLTTNVQATTLNNEEAGKNFFKIVQQQLPVIQDPIINDYLQHLGYRLAAYSDAPAQHFYFFAIQAAVINAFAGPDGYIGVFGGLIDITDTESELASVIAHEIGHVTQYHLQRGENKTRHLTLPALAAMVAAIATGNAAIAASSISSISAGSIQYQINVTRTFEEEADSMGIQTLARAGFNPYAMALFFKKLQTSSRFDSTPPALLLDHPVTEERIALAEQRAQALGPKKHYSSSQAYFLTKARVRYLLAKDNPAFLEQAKDSYRKNPHDFYYRYLLALAYIKNQENVSAQALLQQLMLEDEPEVIYPYTLAQLAFSEKNYPAALTCIQQSYALNPDYYPTVMLYGFILMRDHQASQAVKLLEKYQLTFAQSPDFWHLLSKAYAKEKNFIYAYRARSRAYSVLGELREAVVQLDMAQQQSHQTPYTRALLQAEKIQIQQRLRQ